MVSGKMTSEEYVDLKETAGLPIYLERGRIRVNEKQVFFKEKREYIIKELKEVTIKEDWTQQEEKNRVYTVYKNLILKEHKELWGEVEHDIVIIYPGKMGNEYNKTIGQYRSIADNGFHYPEIYQVIYGYAEFLLQQPRNKHEQVKDAVLIRAQKYEIVVIPPAYGVTIINPSEKSAVLARVRAKEAEEIVEEYKRTRGECYYRLTDGKWVFNTNYNELPVLRLEEPQNKWRLMKRGIPVYMAHIYNPKKSRGLVEPDPAEFIV